MSSGGAGVIGIIFTILVVGGIIYFFRPQKKNFIPWILCKDMFPNYIKPTLSGWWSAKSNGNYLLLIFIWEIWFMLWGYFYAIIAHIIHLATYGFLGTTKNYRYISFALTKNGYDERDILQNRKTKFRNMIADGRSWVSELQREWGMSEAQVYDKFYGYVLNEGMKKLAAEYYAENNTYSTFQQTQHSSPTAQSAGDIIEED